MTDTTSFSNVIRGVAYGDSWGDPNEFQSLGTLIANNPKGPELPEKLFITDDTQMTLFLADALDLSRDGTMDEIKKAIMDAFKAYRTDPDSGSRAPGITVMGSLGRLSGYDWKRATDSHSDGSGTVMRTSPVAFVPEDKWVGIAAFAAAVTHGSANGIAAAILNVAVLRALLAGEVRPGELVEYALGLAQAPQTNGLLDTDWWLEDYPVELRSGFAELARLLGKALDALPGWTEDPWAKTSDPSDEVIGGGGNGGGWRAHETLVIALADVDMLPDDPWEALRRAATSQGDSDTIAAVAGGLLGASGAQWPEDVFIRLEPRYQRWILNEADEYEFGPSEDEEDPELDEVIVEVQTETVPEPIQRANRTLVQRILRSLTG